MGDCIRVRWCDVLKTRGILGSGYGVLPKYAMCDPKLPICSKAIYALICSMAGNGENAFPGRDTMLSYLKLSKDSYYKHMNILKEQGYITVEQTERPGGRFPHNTYFIEDNPVSFQKDFKSGAPYTKQVTLSYTGIKGAGYGIISRGIMCDNRISAKAKAIYAYFASYTGAGTVTFPKQDVILYHLGLNIATYRKFLTELTSLNLVKVVYPHENGHLAACRFILVDHPDETMGKTLLEESQIKAVATGIPVKERFSEAVMAQEFVQGSKNQDTVGKKRKSNLPAKGKRSHPSKNQDTVQQDTVEQDTIRQDTAEQDMVQQDTEKQDANTTGLNSTSLNSISPLEENQSSLASLVREAKLMSSDSLKKNIMKLINFPYSVPTTTQNICVYDALSYVADEIAKHAPTIRINRENLPWDKAVQILLSLQIEDYLSAIDDILREPREINNPPAYFITALYNAHLTNQHLQQRKEDFREKLYAVGNG